MNKVARVAYHKVARRIGLNGLRLVWMAALMFSAAVAHADDAKISEIKIDGNRRVQDKTIAAALSLKVGESFSAEQVTKDLRAVWDKGFFKDIQIFQEVTPAGVILTVKVVEKPAIRKVIYKGNDDVSDEDITEVVNVKPMKILNVELLKTNSQKIRELYVDKGFFLAEVEHEIVPVGKEGRRVDIIFNVKENFKVQVRRIAIVGNSHLSDTDIKTMIQTREGNEISFITKSGTFKDEHFQTDLMRIQALYYDHGFVSIKVGQPTITLTPDRRYIDIVIPVEEGVKYSIGNITFAGDIELKNNEGKVVVTEDILRKFIVSSKGDTFKRTTLFEDIGRLSNVYKNMGYAFANVTPNSKMRPEDKEVDLEMAVQKGDLVYIDRIEISGNTKTRDKVIRREMRVFEGELYSEAGINASKARIFQLGFFENVEIKPAGGAQSDTMTLEVEVKEKSTGTFQVGAGFSSVESFIATAQVAQNNFLGTGQSLSLSLQLSFGTFGRKFGSLQFYEPYLLDSMFSLGLNAYVTQQFYRDFQRAATGFSPTVGYPLTADLRLSLGYTIEQIDISQSSALRRAHYLVDETGGINSAINTSVSYDTRNNRLFPTAGQYHRLKAEISDEILGADGEMEFLRLQLTARYYQPIIWGLVLKLNAEFGYLHSTGEAENSESAPRRAPISERFFPGGIYSVRGFEPRSLGPCELAPLDSMDHLSRADCLNVGGNKQAIFNIELEFPILESAGIKGVLFFDAGNAFNDDQGWFYAGTKNEDKPDVFIIGSDVASKPPMGLYLSTGFGFRWFSPIGPLRFEWGIPITKKATTDDNLIFEFTIGNFF